MVLETISVQTRLLSPFTQTNGHATASRRCCSATARLRLGSCSPARRPSRPSFARLSQLCPSSEATTSLSSLPMARSRQGSKPRLQLSKVSFLSSHRRRILLLVFRPFNRLPVYMCLEGASLTSLAFSPSLFKFSVELCPEHRGRGGWRWSVGDDGRVRRRAATTHIWFSPIPPARRQHLRFFILTKDSRALAAQTTFSSCPSTRS